MSPETKRHLESRIRLLLAGAQRQCNEAHEHEDQARYLRGAAERDRIVASDIQALIDGAPLPVGEIPQAQGQREVQHVDTPDEPEAKGIPPHVWLHRNMLTDLQAVAPLGRDETNGQYAVAIDQLTPKQIQVPHINKQLVQMRDDMCDLATKVWAEEDPGVLRVAADDLGAVAENEIVSRKPRRSDTPT